MVGGITLTVEAVRADPGAALARVCDGRQPLILTTAAGRVPVAVLLDFATYEALRARGAEARPSRAGGDLVAAGKGRP